MCYAAQLAIAYLMLNSEDAAPKDAHKYVRHLGPLLISYYQWPPARAPEFIMGIGIANVGKALAAIKGEKVEKLRLTLSVVGDLSFVALLALAVAPSLLWKTAELPLLLHYAFRMNLFSPMFCLMLLGTGFGKAQCSVVARLCTTWLGLALGELSYGFLPLALHVPEVGLLSRCRDRRWGRAKGLQGLCTPIDRRLGR